jgi:hypothetical protein
MANRPPAPYPDGTPEDWATDVLDHGVRGEGHLSRLGNGDFVFYSGRWQTIHGPATVVRVDRGAYMIWGARLNDGRRVHCQRSATIYGWGHWRRRSDDGRSWVVGTVQLEPSDATFIDGAYQQPLKLDDNVFEIAMSSQPDFIQKLKDDSFGLAFNQLVRTEAVCTLDGTVGWNPNWGECACTIGRLRGFGETEHDFKYAKPMPPQFQTAPSAIIEALAEVGWRLQTVDESLRFEAGER